MLVDAGTGTGWYVRPEGMSYGSGDGRSWTDAWSGFSDVDWDSIACGDTLWVAGGDYGEDLAPGKSCSETARLYVRRARSDATQSTGAAGWSAAFDATVHLVGSNISFRGDFSYVTISGQVTSASREHGWWIDLSERTAGTGIELANEADASFNLFEYMDVQGPGYVTYTGDGRGVDATPFSSATGNVFSHMAIFDWESRPSISRAPTTRPSSTSRCTASPR
jgi:hypothetical protein